MIQTLRINCVQRKLVTDKSRLRISTRLVKGHFCRSVRLLSYSITGNAGALPSHLMLHITGLGSPSEYTTVSGGDNTNVLLDESETKFILYPPGGVATQGRTTREIGFKNGGGVMNVQNLRAELQTYNATAECYERFDDYTECVLELEIESYEYTNAFRFGVL